MELTINLSSWMLPAGITVVALIAGVIIARNAQSSGWGCDIMALIGVVGCAVATVTAWVVWAAMLL